LEKRTEQILPGSGDGGKGGEVAQTMYTHLSKCENDKIKREKKKNKRKQKIKGDQVAAF
jgi:hypothetical protein